MQHNKEPRLEVLMIIQASSGNNESRYHQAAPAEYDFPVFPVVSEACLKEFINI